MKIDRLDETKTIHVECSFIRGRLEGVTGRKALGTLNSATRSTVSAPKMGLDDDNLNIKVVPLGDVKLFMLKTLSLEAISFSFYAVPKSDVNTCPPVFRQSLHAEK
jgi:hypothetical protein